jgi:8-oxo-dGTP diphosphatase
MNNNIHVLSRGVIIDQGYILLAYDPRLNPNHYYELNVPFYYLPGGHIDFQESGKNALITFFRYLCILVCTG